LKLPHTKSVTNFIFFDTGHPQAELAVGMRKARIEIARPFPPYSNWARITIGLPRENLAAQQRLRQLMGA